MGRWLGMLVVGGGAAMFAQTAGDDAAILERVFSRAEANLSRLPDYICLQRVERFRRESPWEEFRPVDVINVEVGLMGDRELFAWPDSSRFGEEEISEMVRHGAIGNGSFGLFARNLLVSRAADFTFRGEEELDGVVSLRYDFEVPLERSSYAIRVPPWEERVAYHGSIWVSADSLDVLQIAVIADEIPEALRIVEAHTQLRYSRVPIGGASFLLPRSADLLITGADGDASRNLTSFGSCRQYVGESSISFGGAAGDAEHAAVAEAAATESGLPPRAVLDLDLSKPIDPRRAAVGDPVRALLAKPLRVGSTVLAPRGATVLGRLIRLDHYAQPIGHYVIGLEFHTIDLGGRLIRFTATMRHVSGPSALFKPSRRIDPSFARKRKGFLDVLVNENQRGLGILHWKADKPLIGHLRMEWEVEGR